MSRAVLSVSSAFISLSLACSSESPPALPSMGGMANGSGGGPGAGSTGVGGDVGTGAVSGSPSFFPGGAGHAGSAGAEAGGAGGANGTGGSAGVAGSLGAAGAGGSGSSTTGGDGGAGAVNVVIPEGAECPAKASAPSDCSGFCACWFSRCLEFPLIANTYASWEDCMSECGNFTDFGCRAYRVNNNPASGHCKQAIPGSICP